MSKCRCKKCGFDKEATDKAIAQLIKRIGFASISIFLIMLFLLLVK